MNIKNNILKYFFNVIGSSTIIFVRETIVKIFSFKLIGVEFTYPDNYPFLINDKIIISNKLLYKNFLFNFISPFFFFGIHYIFKYNKINYLYKLENIYFYEDYSSSKLMNIVVKITNDEDDITEVFKKYHPNVPFYLFLLNENISFNDINITSFVKGKITKNKVNNIFLKIHELC